MEEPESRLARARQTIERDLAMCPAHLTAEYPVDRYLALFDALPALAPYHSLPADAATMLREIEARGGIPALEAYNRLAMLVLIERGSIGTGLKMTPEARSLQTAELDRILADLAAPRKGFYRQGKDPFAKDFAVCRGKLLPCGVELVDPCAGVGRRFLLAGMGQMLRGLGFFARMGGFKPLLALHFDRRRIAAFDAKGYADLYLRLADLLILNPHVKGVVSSSWWHDPALADISPELDFIGRIPESAGAQVFRSGTNAAATADALRFAPRRIELHKAGAYAPRVHMLAWTRGDVIAWARDHRARG